MSASVMATIEWMTTEEYVAWLKQQSNALCRIYDRPLLYPDSPVGDIRCQSGDSTFATATTQERIPMSTTIPDYILHPGDPWTPEHVAMAQRASRQFSTPTAPAVEPKISKAYEDHLRNPPDPWAKREVA